MNQIERIPCIGTAPKWPKTGKNDGTFPDDESWLGQPDRNYTIEVKVVKFPSGQVCFRMSKVAPFLHKGRRQTGVCRNKHRFVPEKLIGDTKLKKPDVFFIARQHSDA